jgi:UDP-2,3-diacylglucosamine hydrolase
VGEKLGLIAGSGCLPFEVAAAARDQGLQLVIAAIEGNTDPRIEGLGALAFTWLAPGELGRLIEFFKGAHVSEVILAGAVSKRELLKHPERLRPDARALALLARTPLQGDDAILRAIAGEIESEGMKVVDSTLHLSDRLTPLGVLAGAPSAAILRDLEFGLRVARTLGVHDVGQSVVVKDGSVLALEAIEGTDATLERGAQFGAGACLVKAAKPRQDLRFDVPVIGPGTVDLAARSGVAAIGLEAGRTLILERPEALARAERAGIAVVGLQDAEP